MPLRANELGGGISQEGAAQSEHILWQRSALRSKEMRLCVAIQILILGPTPANLDLLSLIAPRDHERGTAVAKDVRRANGNPKAALPNRKTAPKVLDLKVEDEDSSRSAAPIAIVGEPCCQPRTLHNNSLPRTGFCALPAAPNAQLQRYL